MYDFDLRKALFFTRQRKWSEVTNQLHRQDVSASTSLLSVLAGAADCSERGFIQPCGDRSLIFVCPSSHLLNGGLSALLPSTLPTKHPISSPSTSSRMAEAIGVVSGVITFIDAGKKVLDLCTRIKDAPEKIAAYQQHLEDALFNVENLKQRLQSNTNPNISIARKDLDFVDNLLIRCTEHLLALQQTLGYLDNEFKGGRRRHAWASLVAVRRSGEILGIFSKLQNGLNSLKSFLIQQNFWMLQGQRYAQESKLRNS